MGKDEPYPTSVVVIGGGIAGLMSAYHILKSQPGTKLTLLEKGDSIPYAYGTSTRSAACTRQQFGCRHNVEMSLYSTRFYERFAEITGCEYRMLWQPGYLFLYRDKKLCQTAYSRVAKQQSWGLEDVRALSAEETIRQFPYVVNHGLAGSTFCPTDGFLDPNLILQAMRSKIVEMGAEVRTGAKVSGIQFFGDRAIAVVLEGGGMIPCDFLINCSGVWSSRIAKKLGTDLPVMPEKRYLWTAKLSKGRDFDDQEYDRMPMTVCMGTRGKVPYVKPEPSKGEHILTVGCEHAVEPAWDFKDTDQDYVDPWYRPGVSDGYHEDVWLQLCEWVDYAESLVFLPRVASGFYETTRDHNPFIDFDPGHSNVIHCAGFSGHGIMHGPAAGKIVADLLKYGDYTTFPSAEPNVGFAGYQAGTRETEAMKI